MGSKEDWASQRVAFPRRKCRIGKIRAVHTMAVGSA